MKKSRIFGLGIFFLIGAILLSGCQQQGNEPSFFQSTFVEPLAGLIHLFAELTGGSFGLAIIMITFLIRVVVMPLMLK
ncbi:hypothetical protein [Bacillus sp. T33-2]|uniref:hypothetical protein n=1 Tax=Bacillus sp. T33-2 TaxID=2054168 RepID=UPI002698964B